MLEATAITAAISVGVALGLVLDYLFDSAVKALTGGGV